MAERGAVRVSACGCSPGECWEIRCSDCGRIAEGYDDETVSDYIAHWPSREDALEDCASLGFEWWDDAPRQPVLCSGCIDERLDDAV